MYVRIHVFMYKSSVSKSAGGPRRGLDRLALRAGSLVFKLRLFNIWKAAAWNARTRRWIAVHIGSECAFVQSLVVCIESKRTLWLVSTYSFLCICRSSTVEETRYKYLMRLRLLASMLVCAKVHVNISSRKKNIPEYVRNALNSCKPQS